MSTLASAEPAGAHLQVVPTVVERGVVTELAIELPVIVPGPDLVRLVLEGPGLDVLSTRKLDRPGPESHWAARVRVDGPPGPLPVVLRAVYADGDTVDFRASFTVVPAEDDPFPWELVLGGSVLAAAAAAGGLALARRRTA